MGTEHSVTEFSHSEARTGSSAAEGDAERRGFPGYPHDTDRPLSATTGRTPEHGSRR